MGRGALASARKWAMEIRRVLSRFRSSNNLAKPQVPTGTLGTMRLRMIGGKVAERGLYQKGRGLLQSQLHGPWTCAPTRGPGLGSMLNAAVLKFLQKNFFLGGLFRVAHGNSQARGQIGAVAAGLHHSHSHTGSELPLCPAPQLVAMPDP